MSLERDTGIEPVPQPWEGRILPLYKSRSLNSSVEIVYQKHLEMTRRFLCLRREFYEMVNLEFSYGISVPIGKSSLF